MNRSELNRLLSKAIAYKNAGNVVKAKESGDQLVKLLISYGLANGVK